MKRRDFLRASAASGAAALGASVWTKRANAVPFGEIPQDKQSSMLPEQFRAQSVLECFLYGGVIPWETYYCVPGRGQADETWAYTNYDFMIKASEGCGFDGAAQNPFTFFAKDSEQQEIFFGPYMGKLLARPDILERMRIVINRHKLSPHEAAIPLVASGRSLGNPALAGLSTHVNRYFVDRDTAGDHPPPFAYGFATGSQFIPNDGVLSLVAQGLHPGQARPLLVKVDSAARLNTLLSRTTVAVTGVILDVIAVGDTVLVSYQVDSVGAEATVALAAGTNTVRWVHPARMLAALPRDGLVLLHENTGDPQWYGIDVASGRIHWSLSQPVSGYTTVAVDRGGLPSRLVTADVNGRIEVHDATTGALTAQAHVHPPPDWRNRGISMWPVDDMVLIGGRDGTTAYALADLSMRWTNHLDLSERYVLPHCQDAVCAVGSFDGVRVLDPATGAQRWAAYYWSALEQVGAYLLADGPVGSPVEPQAVVDPVTGAKLGDFGPWRSIGDPRPDGTIIGLWNAPQDVVWYASLNPATRAVRVLGSADRVSGDCRITPDVLICRRLDASVGIWRLG